MSNYTITIKNLIKNGFDFGLNNYPIFEEKYRETLNKKILNHYYLDEIGLETPELFKFYLNNTMNEIMPYYNELYKQQLEAFEKMYDTVDVKEIFEKKLIQDGNSTLKSTINDITTSNGTNTLESNSSSNSSSENTTKTKNVEQKTPQGKLINENIDNFSYASNLDMNKNETNSSINDESSASSTNTINSTDTKMITNDNNTTNKNNTDENYTKTITGNQGLSSLDIYEKFKNNFVNIDLQIIYSLSDLFMGLY